MFSDNANIATREQIASGPFSGTRAQVISGDPEGVGVNTRLGIVVARFNSEITLSLLRGAQQAASQFSIPDENLTVVWVPGAFELPIVARSLAWTGAFDAIVCLGAVIRGETGHYDFVAGESASGIQRIALDTGVPTILGVLTTDNFGQAKERAGGTKGNKGFESVVNALEMVDVLRNLENLTSEIKRSDEGS